MSPPTGRRGSSNEEGKRSHASVHWSLVFLAVLAFVACVSLYDGYLVVRTGDLIVDFERNPVGLFLIHFDGDNPALFLRAKAAVTILVLAILCFLYRRKPRMARAVALGLVVFQFGLLIFLIGPFS